MVLEQIDLQISAVKEEAFSRKDILERVEKWLAACDEESWLEEYNRVGIMLFFVWLYFAQYILYMILTLWFIQDENRYSAGRGAHLTLKRAEKARAIVNKLPSNGSMTNIIYKSQFQTAIY